MPTFVHLPSGNWRAVIRRKGRTVAETFRRKIDAEGWALEMERRVDLGQDVSTNRPASLATPHPAQISAVGFRNRPRIVLAASVWPRLSLGPASPDAGHEKPGSNFIPGMAIEGRPDVAIENLTSQPIHDESVRGGYRNVSAVRQAGSS
jgi:hypothetical protein